MKQKFYPYPVLGNGDDINGEFIPSAYLTIEQINTTIKCNFETTNKYIAELIKNKIAVYCVEIECSSTFFRLVKRTDGNNIEISIPSNKLKETVNVSFYICAATKINDYAPNGMHPDFDGEIFDINCGDVLATGIPTSFIADKKFDPLNAPISSIIKIMPTQNKEEMQVDYEGERIIIELPQKDYDLYLSIKNNSADMLHSSIVLPVLVDAIYEANGQGSGKYKNSDWSNRLKQMLKARNIDTGIPLLDAQKLLESPINRILNWRKKFEDNSND